MYYYRYVYNRQSHLIIDVYTEAVGILLCQSGYTYKKMALLILISCILLKITFACNCINNCPRMCTCYTNEELEMEPKILRSNSLMVDCVRRDVNDSTLAQELDMLLSDELKEKLIWVRINSTTITQIPISVCQLLNVVWLHLDNNRLTQIPDNCFTNMTRLKTLTAENNSITELQNGLFDGLNSLTFLSFANNMITSIGLDVFSNPNDLISLRQIVLNHNRLRWLEPWPYIRGLHGSKDSKVHIWLDYNLISYFTNKIEWQFSCTCSRQSFTTVHMAYNYVRHLSDITSGWNVTVHQWFHLMHFDYDFPSMQFQPLAFKLDYTYSYDYYCNCVDIDFYLFSKRNSNKNSIFTNVKCIRPQSLSNRFVNQVPLNDFVCKISDRCPSSCHCVQRPANFTVHVDCSSANLSSLPLDLPPLPSSYYKYKLDVSNNRLLRRLEYRPYLYNTNVFDVSNCAIDFVEFHVWQQFAMMPSELHALSIDTENLTYFVATPVVFLHSNKIKSLPFHVTDINLTSVHFTLNDNPWKCSCDSQWMIGWLQSLSSPASSNVNNVLCASPSRLKGRSILQSNKIDFCVDPTSKMLKIILTSTLSVVAGLLMLGFALYCLRVRIYKRWKFHPFDRDECVEEEMDYDVFLCCCSEDNTPHGLHILQLIESKGYRVCYHLRDFLPGELVSDNMMQSIIRSKRTVCLLSSNFLQR